MACVSSAQTRCGQSPCCRPASSAHDCMTHSPPPISMLSRGSAAPVAHLAVCITKCRSPRLYLPVSCASCTSQTRLPCRERGRAGEGELLIQETHSTRCPYPPSPCVHSRRRVLTAGQKAAAEARLKEIQHTTTHLASLSVARLGATILLHILPQGRGALGATVIKRRLNSACRAASGRKASCGTGAQESWSPPDPSQWPRTTPCPGPA